MSAMIYIQFLKAWAFKKVYVGEDIATDLYSLFHILQNIFVIGITIAVISYVFYTFYYVWGS